jgi:uncharacterized protein YggE
MKQFPPFTNIVLQAGVLILLLAIGLPAVKAQTVSPTQPYQASAEAGLDCDPSRTVQVSGSALINILPDRATVQLGVQSNGVTPDEVQLSNSAAMQKVVKALKAQGIEDRDIATNIYVVEPVYEEYNSLFIKGYRINNMVAVTLRDVAKTSLVITAALKAGANQVINVDFFTSELRKYRDQARELAVKAAQEKAQALAKAAGSEAGCPLQLSENSWSYYNGWWYGNNQNAWTQNVVQNAAPSGGSGNGSSSEEPISLGQISVKAEVTATFALK